MLSAADWAAMRADLDAIHADNPTTITIRRGSTTLAPQSVRITRSGSKGRTSTGGPLTKESRMPLLVAGSPELDIHVDDRFNDANGDLYRVIIVRQNRRASVEAEAELVE